MTDSTVCVCVCTVLQKRWLRILRTSEARRVIVAAAGRRRGGVAAKDTGAEPRNSLLVVASGRDVPEGAALRGADGTEFEPLKAASNSVSPYTVLYFIGSRTARTEFNIY